VGFFNADWLGAAAYSGATASRASAGRSSPAARRYLFLPVCTHAAICTALSTAKAS